MTKKKSKSKKQNKKYDEKLQAELAKLGNADIFEPSKNNPDDFKEFPVIVVCKTNPKDYIYPIMLKLEHSNIVRLTAMNRYIATVLRICDLFTWCMDTRLKRKRVMRHIETNKPLIVNEYILEKIPPCRR